METNLSMFCQAFNERSGSLRLSEENTFQCEETEYLLYADDILLRLQTDDDQCIHTVLLTAERAQIEILHDAAQTAFAILSEPFSEMPPASFLAQIKAGDTAVMQTDTKHFVYLIYRSPESVTVQQINRHLRELPSLPELHSERIQPSSQDNASRSH